MLRLGIGLFYYILNPYYIAILTNLGLSASHKAFGSIRMEPGFMVFGQSAAIAGVLAIREEVPQEELDYKPFQK